VRDLCGPGKLRGRHRRWVGDGELVALPLVAGDGAWLVAHPQASNASVRVIVMPEARARTPLRRIPRTPITTSLRTAASPPRIVMILPPFLCQVRRPVPPGPGLGGRGQRARRQRRKAT